MGLPDVSVTEAPPRPLIYEGAARHHRLTTTWVCSGGSPGRATMQDPLPRHAREGEPWLSYINVGTHTKGTVGGLVNWVYAYCISLYIIMI